MSSNVILLLSKFYYCALVCTVCLCTVCVQLCVCNGVYCVYVFCRVLSVLEGIGTRKEEMDMSRMRTILRRSVLKVLESLENSPEYHFAFNIIGDFLFADNPEQVWILSL